MAKNYFQNDKILMTQTEAFGVFTVTLDGCINTVWFVAKGKRVPQCQGHARNVEGDLEATLTNARALISNRIERIQNPKPPPPFGVPVSIFDL